MVDDRLDAARDVRLSRIDWGPVIAGALTAAGFAFVLHSFAAAIGISVSSTAPTWRDASVALILLSGLYLLLAALLSYSLGAYVAGRLRPRFGTADDVSFSDGMHGILVWALATLMAALLAGLLALGASRLAAPSGATTGPSSSVASENIIAFDLDRLFRGRQIQGDVEQLRAEAGRILLTASSHRGMLDEDRAYLVRMVSAVTGLSAADAERRVGEVTAQAKENIGRARRSAGILGFMIAASALLGVAASWFACSVAGRHRDGLDSVPSYLEWDRPYRRV
jgi:hypothetical protein